MSQRLALIIGNDIYDDKNLSRLKAPGADVKQLARILRDPEIGAFDEVKILINEISSTVQRSIAYFFSRKSREDLLLLYFSGHGVLDDQGRLFLAVKDTARDLPTGTAIPAAFITDEMNRSRSKRQILMLDCCHSGAFARGTKKALGANVGTGAVFEGTGFGRVVITATDSTQYAWEGDQVIGEAENSVFTHYLIRGLETGEADRDHDGYINLDELYDYVFEHVVNETPRQTPGKWSYRQQGDIIIARNPLPVIKPAGLPPELQQAIENPLPEVREGALQVLETLLNSVHREVAQAALEALQKLAKDDSRRVSCAANEILVKYAKTPDIEDIVTEKEKSGLEGKITIDEGGIIREFNTAAMGIFGYAADEIIGRNVSTLMPSPYREDHDRYIANYLKTGKKRIIGLRREVVGQHKDGTTFPMDIMVNEVQVENRLDQGYIETQRFFTALVQNISERKKAEEALQEILEAADVPAEIEPAAASSPDEAKEIALPQKIPLEKFKVFLATKKFLFILTSLFFIVLASVAIWYFQGPETLPIAEKAATSPLTDDETKDVNSKPEMTVETTPTETVPERPISASLNIAQNKLQRSRNRAVSDQAEVYASDFFNTARQKEEQANQALEARDYDKAEKLFLEAEKGYRQSSESASAVRSALERKATEANNAEQVAINARQAAENNAAKTFAEAAYDYALKKEKAGRQHLANKQYAAAISAFNEAVTGYERAGIEKKALENAEALFRKGDYINSLKELESIFANPPYEGENTKARELWNTVEKAQRAFEQRLSEARNAKNNGDLTRALNILDNLPGRERNSSSVERLRNDIIKSDHSAPQISHDKPKPYKRKQSITVNVTVTDNLKVERVLLNYKLKNETEYLRKEMTPAGENQYSASIPANYHNGKDVYYYFAAKDSNGNETLDPTNKDNPYKIRREDDFVPPRPP